MHLNSYSFAAQQRLVAPERLVKPPACPEVMAGGPTDSGGDKIRQSVSCTLYAIVSPHTHLLPYIHPAPPLSLSGATTRAELEAMPLPNGVGCPVGSLPYNTPHSPAPYSLFKTQTPPTPPGVSVGNHGQTLPTLGGHALVEFGSTTGHCKE